MQPEVSPGVALEVLPVEKPSTYTMRMSLNILDHLGLNLYSNIPAVLSEVVANSWDADASTVTITIDAKGKKITIVDDGTGMSESDLNDHFLYVGYRRRDGSTAKTHLGRHVMGRKGIGKLSLFAIADTIRVESSKDGECAGFIMSAEKIRSQMTSHEGIYHPDELQRSDMHVTKGTTITLTDLRVSPNTGTQKALRKRLARRFSIIDPVYQFAVSVNNEEITVADRDYYPNVEFLWSLGDVADQYEDLCANALNKSHLTGEVDTNKGWVVRGWVGTVDEQKHIDEESNVIPVLAWGKLIHEDLLSAIKPSGVFAKYLLGEIHADFVDDDGQPDIATSDRQSLKETDPRYESLKKYLNDVVLKAVGNAWRDWRRDNAMAKARKNPVIEEWFNALTEDAQKYARNLFGKIGNMPLSSEKDRIELYRNGILAFEKLRLRDLLSEIDKLDGHELLNMVGRVFASIDEIEVAQYGDIARGRVSVISSFIDIIDSDEKENVLQRYLFDHLWLLDSSWERATTNARMEESVTREFDNVTNKLTSAEKKGRLDIRYKTVAGKHIIVELKRYSVVVSTGDLVTQIGKYRSALKKSLKEKYPNDTSPIEAIIVLGKFPSDLSPDEVQRTLAGSDTRIVTYDTLIQGALDSYKDYIERHDSVSRLADLIARLDKSAVEIDEA